MYIYIFITRYSVWMRYDDITDGVDGGEAEAARAPRQVAALQEPEAVIEPLEI